MRRKFPYVRSLRNIGVLLIALSAFQYASQGTISWPQNTARWVTTTVSEYVRRPQAGWRKAAERLEQLGAAKEASPAPHYDLTGRVVRVADGDTLSVLDADRVQHKIRLYGIDTPEWNQAHGRAAKRALTVLVDEKMVGVVVVDTDSYGRTVGTVYQADTNVNLAMVAAGHAWWYRRLAPHEHPLEAAEQQARQNRLGLWSAANPVPPWDWRRRHD